MITIAINMLIIGVADSDESRLTFRLRKFFRKSAEKSHINYGTEVFCMNISCILYIKLSPLISEISYYKQSNQLFK